MEMVRGCFLLFIINLFIHELPYLLLSQDLCAQGEGEGHTPTINQQPVNISPGVKY